MTASGYDFCLINGIQFKQRTGRSGTIYWYGVASHYYGQPGREYKSAGFPDLRKTIKATLEYLAKCSVNGADEMKKQMDEEALASEEQVDEIAPESLLVAATENKLVRGAFALSF